MTDDPIRAALHRNRWHYRALGLTSAAVNVTLLAGPLYMMQVYDRVLGTGSVETLLALSIIAAGVIAAGAVFDILRHALLHRLAARLQEEVEPRVFAASLAAGGDPRGAALDDLDSLLRHHGGAAFLALCDLPFAALFLAVLWLFHPALGLLAVATAGVLGLLALLARRMEEAPLSRATRALQEATALARELAGEAETLRGLGMGAATTARWQDLRREALAATVQSRDIAALFGGLMRGLRLLVQSAILGLGAYLVLQHALGGGAIFVSSILLGRALAPVEVPTAQWPQIRRARIARARLARLGDLAPRVPASPLPPPQGELALAGVGLDHPATGARVLDAITFTLPAGEVLQVMGQSGAGKSALARIIARVAEPDRGEVTLDGAPLPRHSPARLDQAIGYLPQKVAFFGGTIARNIARMGPVDDSALLRAAEIAGVQSMILALPQGYDTACEAGLMSAGRLQQLALARAVYGGPKLVVLDAPDAHLDESGRIALRHAVARLKAEGTTVVVCSHDFGLSEIADRILCLSGGRMALYGPRAQVLQQLVTSAARQRGDAA